MKFSKIESMDPATLTAAQREVLRHRPAGVSAVAFLEMTEAERRAAILAAATPPECCGPEIGTAPGRGGFRVFQPQELRYLGDGKWKAEDVGYLGRNALRAADVFDQMDLQARKAAKKSGRDYQRNFTPLQVAVGRHYAALVERHNASGLRCSSVEAARGAGGGGAEGFLMAVMGEGETIRRMRVAIGDGVALAVRRVRPSVRGTKAGIRDRVLVDAVCLQGQALSAVLVANGWAKQSGNLEALRVALCAALDRMARV